MAQLGARVNGIHEVAGSIPASSTKPHSVRAIDYFLAILRFFVMEPTDKTHNCFAVS